MAKAKKIDIKNVTVTENTDNTLIVAGEEIEFDNLTSEIREMLKLGSALNIKITKAPKKSGKPSTKKAIYKYHCPNCGMKIKTNEENLKIECVDCKVEYVLEEES